MSLELGTPDTTTAEADAPQTDTAPATTPATQAAVGQPERTYTRADLDAAYAEARKWKRDQETQLESRRREYEQRQPEQDPIARDISSLKQEVTAFKLDQSIAQARTRHPELQDDAKLREVLDLVVQKGLDRVTHLSIDDVLDTAYRYWAHDELSKRASQPIDVEKIRREAADQGVKDYLAKKTATSAAAPKAEGPGGSTPASNADRRDKVKTRKGAFDAALEYVTRSKAE